MTGAHGQLFGHLAKRSADFVMRPVLDASSKESLRQSLEKQASLYEESGVKDVRPFEVLVVFFTLVFFVLVYVTIKYAVGQVVASLAMIEQPRTALLLAESDEADAPLGKNGQQDEELLVVKEKPITASIRGALRHLKTIGGRRALFRGLSIAIFYNIALALLTQILATVLHVVVRWAPLSMVLGSTIATVMLARIHMTWTHIMISHPSPLRWYRRIPRGRTYFKTLLTPAIIYALCQHLSVLMPVMTYLSFGKVNIDLNNNPKEAKHELLRLLATVLVAAFVAIAVLLPASVTLIRVEASLLPDDAETIVPFDRTLGGASANLVGFGKINFVALYDAAWRSFDRASRIRLIKFYIKYNVGLVAISFIFAFALVGEILFFGAGRLQVFLQSAVAQLQLAAMDAN